MGEAKRPKEVKSNITDNQSAKMTTSKGTIQGYNGLASVDKKHQIIIDAQVFGAGQEHHTLQPILEAIEQRYRRLNINSHLYQSGIIVTADTGFANEANMSYLHEKGINGYIPDNKFRSRDPKFAEQKGKYGKRHQNEKKKVSPKQMPASAFQVDIIKQTCTCPAGNSMWLKRKGKDHHDNDKLYFEGHINDCRHCKIKAHCMRQPEASNSTAGRGRQVSFISKKSKGKVTYTDRMKHRVDSRKGKLIYSHRMSVVEPVFANIGTNKKLKSFSLRTQKKVQAQWQLYCLIHNIEKLKN